MQLDEVRPGLGRLDYAVYLANLAQLDPDTPLMLEHLATEHEYQLAAAYIRGVTPSCENVTRHVESVYDVHTYSDTGSCAGFG